MSENNKDKFSYKSAFEKILTDIEDELVDEKEPVIEKEKSIKITKEDDTLSIDTLEHDKHPEEESIPLIDTPIDAHIDDNQDSAILELKDEKNEIAEKKENEFYLDDNDESLSSLKNRRTTEEKEEEISLIKPIQNGEPILEPIAEEDKIDDKADELPADDSFLQVINRTGGKKEETISENENLIKPEAKKDIKRIKEDTITKSGEYDPFSLDLDASSQQESTPEIELKEEVDEEAGNSSFGSNEEAPEVIPLKDEIDQDEEPKQDDFRVRHNDEEEKKDDDENGFGLNFGGFSKKKDDENEQFKPQKNSDEEENKSQLKGDRDTIADEEEIRPGFRVYRNKDDEPSISGKSKKISRDEDPSQKTVLFELQFKPRLELVSGKMPQKSYELSKEDISIGRGRENDIVLYDSNASRNHSRIIKDGGDYFIEDLDSRNGTMINGKFVKREKLTCHDIICFGDISFEFLEGEEKAQDSPPNIMEVSDIPNNTPNIVEPPKLPKFGAKKKGFNLSPEKRRKYIVYFFFLCLVLPTIYTKHIKPRLIQENSEKQKELREAIDKKDEVEVNERDKMLTYLLNQGKYLFEQGKYSEASEKFDQALKIDPQNEEAIAMKDKCESALALKREMDDQKKSEVLARERSSKITDLENQAMTAFNKGELTQTLSILQELEQLEPKNELVKRYIPIIRARKNELSKKEASATKRKELFEERTKLAEKYYYDRNIYGAIVELKKVITDGDLSPDAKKQLSDKLDVWERELTDKLKSKLESSQTLWENGEKLQARRLLSEILSEYPEYREAKVEYEKITHKIQEEAYNMYNDGRVYEANDDIANAVDSYEKVLNLLEPGEEYYKKAKEKLASLKHFQ